MPSSPFLSSISQAMRQKGYALKTEKTYLHWIKRFMFFRGKQHPKDMGSEEVRAFLSHLANQHHVATGTHIYTHVLGEHFAGTHSPLDALN